MLFVSLPLCAIEKELDHATSGGRHVWVHLEANGSCEVIRDITVVAKLDRIVSTFSVPVYCTEADPPDALS